MLYTFLALLAVLASGITLIRVQSNKDYYNQSESIIGIGVASVTLSLIGLMIFSMLCIYYVSAGYKAELINKEYKTHYTQAEVFYGSDVIDQIQQVKRQRIEINGNLLKDDGNK